MSIVDQERLLVPKRREVASIGTYSYITPYVTGLEKTRLQCTIVNVPGLQNLTL